MLVVPSSPAAATIRLASAPPPEYPRRQDGRHPRTLFSQVQSTFRSGTRSSVFQLYDHGAIASNASSRVDSHDMSDDREFAPPQMLDRWLVRGAFAAVVTLQFSLINDFGYSTRR